MEKIVYLKQLQEFFEILRNREEFVDVPYLHEIISKEDVKKYKKKCANIGVFFLLCYN